MERPGLSGFDLFQERLCSFFPGLPLLPVLFPSFSSFFLGGSICFSVPDNLGRNPGDGIVKVRLFQLALPDDDHAPAFSLQLSPDFLIPLLVPGNLCLPKFGVGLWDSIILTVLVAMPKTAVHEDGRPVFGQNDIWRPGKTIIIYSITEALTPKGVTQAKLRASIFGSVMRQAFESLLRRHFSTSCLANLHRIE